MKTKDECKCFEGMKKVWRTHEQHCAPVEESYKLQGEPIGNVWFNGREYAPVEEKRKRVYCEDGCDHFADYNSCVCPCHKPAVEKCGLTSIACIQTGMYCEYHRPSPKLAPKKKIKKFSEEDDGVSFTKKVNEIIDHLNQQ